MKQCENLATIEQHLKQTQAHSSSVIIYVGLNMHKQVLIGHVECLLFCSVYTTTIATYVITEFRSLSTKRPSNV